MPPSKPVFVTGGRKGSIRAGIRQYGLAGIPGLCTTQNRPSNANTRPLLALGFLAFSGHPAPISLGYLQLPCSTPQPADILGKLG